MRRVLLSGVAAFALCGFAATAHAGFIPTTASFFTLATPATATFTFEGHSAIDTDTMYLSFDLGTPIFVNQTSSPGGSYTTGVLAAGVHQLSLIDTSVADTWSSDPAKNFDGKVHLVADATYADFKLGAPPVVAPIYYGWEDRPFPVADFDYNDLIFALSTRAVPEPASLAIIGVGLCGLGLLRRRRRA